MTCNRHDRCQGFSRVVPAGPRDGRHSGVADAASRESVTLDLKAASETDNTYFKRFRNNPTLSITYNPATR